MEYDEIDQYIDQLFRDQQAGGEPPEILSGDWRIDRIDQIIQDAYDEAIWWHNARISAGSDPRSGLRNLPYIPWDERIDGVAAMQGSIGGLSESSYARNGGAWRAKGEPVPQPAPKKRRGWIVKLLVIIVVIVLACMVCPSFVYVP
jgi:hypothetical protein